MANIVIGKASEMLVAIRDWAKGKFVAKEAGKGLSANDFTNALKTKLDGIETGADVNTIESVKVNGVALTPDANKAVDVAVPTKTSDLTNDSSYVSDGSYVHTDNNYTTTEKNKLSGVESGAQANVLEGVKVNGTEQTITGKKVDITVPTKVSDLTNDSDFQTETEVDEKIAAAVTGALQPAGSIPFASLPSLVKANLNKMYNITDAFTTTSDFVEGAGKSYPAGTNVAIINVGTSASPSYKYDAYTGAIDLSGYATTSDLASGLAGKVDKVSGKGLSANDFTDALKTKLDGIEAGAEANVQADWNETDTTSDAYINNKPTIPVVDSALSGSSENAVQNKVVKAALDGKAASSHSHTVSDITDLEFMTSTEMTNILNAE